MRTPARTHNASCLIYAFALVLLSGLATGPAYAQPRTGKVSCATDVDSSRAYFFRGLKQAREGFVAQSYADINFDVYANDDGVGLTGVTFTMGQWNSPYTGPSGSDRPLSGPRPGNVKAWYESCFFTGFTLGIDNWKTAITYPSYLSPNDSFGAV